MVVAEELTRSRELAAQALGRQSAFWGLGKTAGEIYGTLYLSRDPVSLEEVAARLSLTKGNISIAVRQLEQLGMVRRSWRKGDRRVFFEAEADFWKIAQSFLGLRHRPEFGQSFAMLEESVALAGESDQGEEKDTVMERLKALQDFYRLLDSVVEGLLGLTPDRLKWLAGMLAQMTAGQTPSDNSMARGGGGL
jgi:DNA-binding transcriptional regulator GbsR (MarR family)